MGRGSTSQAYQGSLIYANIKGGKKGENVHFELSKKDADGKTVSEGTEKSLSGYLVGLAFRSWTYNGQANESIVLQLNDPEAGNGGETYRIELSADGSMGRNVMNSLLAAPNFLAPLKVNVWNTKEEGYANITLFLGGDKLGWKLSIDEQKAHITTITEPTKNPTTGKIENKEKKIYLALNEYLKNEVTSKVIPLVKPRQSASGAIVSAPQYEGHHEQTQNAAPIEDGQKLPWEES